MFVHLCLALCIFLGAMPQVFAKAPGEVGAISAATKADMVPDASTRIKRVSPTLYRGPRLSEKVLEELHRLGVKTIVIARTNSQKKFHKRAQELGLNVIHLRIGVFRQPDDSEIDMFLRIANDPDRQPVYIACYAGEDRTSFFVAIYRMLHQNWTWEQAYAEMKQCDLKEWWYVFRDYKKTIREYTERKLKERPSLSSARSDKDDI